MMGSMSPGYLAFHGEARQGIGLFNFWRSEIQYFESAATPRVPSGLSARGCKTVAPQIRGKECQENANSCKDWTSSSGRIWAG